jgi:DNA-binding NtrC family response regulator
MFGPMQSRVLIVDDDEEMREALEGVFSTDSFACDLAADANAALAIVDRQTFDVVISDVMMVGMSGLELLDRLRKAHPALPVVVITGDGGIKQAVDAVKRGAFEYLVKPCGADELRRVVASAMHQRQPAGETTRHSRPPVADDSFTIVGAGPAMRTLQTAIDCVARSSAPVLVPGETGSGKELVARAIHARSVRCDRPFR